jgi:hypothetical protein
MIGGKYYTWSSYVLMVITILIGIFIYLQGGQFFDVGKTVSENKREIIDNQRRIEELQQKLEQSLKQGKDMAGDIVRGREERYISQDKYMTELLISRDRIISLEANIASVENDHKKRLEIMKNLLAEVKELKGKLDLCIEVRK